MSYFLQNLYYYLGYVEEEKPPEIDDKQKRQKYLLTEQIKKSNLDKFIKYSRMSTIDDMIEETKKQMEFEKQEKTRKKKTSIIFPGIY